MLFGDVSDYLHGSGEGHGNYGHRLGHGNGYGHSYASYGSYGPDYSGEGELICRYESLDPYSYGSGRLSGSGVGDIQAPEADRPGYGYGYGKSDGSGFGYPGVLYAQKTNLVVATNGKQLA